MNKVVKRILITLICVVGGVGLVVGGLMIYRHMNVKPVGVYNIANVAMTDFWGDTSETEGYVETRNMQSIYVSSTQKISEVFVTEGQMVKVGDPIMSVDTTLTEIELERQRIKVEQKKLELETAEKELARINTYVPYVPPAPEPEPEVIELPAEALPKFLGGQGTAERPYIYMWNSSQWYTESFIDGFLPKIEEAPAADEAEGAEETEEAPENPEEKKEITISVVFEVHEYDNSKGEMLDNWQIDFTRKEDGSVAFRIGEPVENYDGSQIVIDDPESDEPIYYGPQYTWTEIQEMKAEKTEQIRDLELEVRVESVKYEKLQMEMETGVITATVDGVVKSLIDEDTAKLLNQPMCVISGGGGYYIVGSLSELELDTIKVGQTVTVTSWMNYAQLEAEIVEISEYPSTNGWNWTNGNNNVSFYPFTVFVSDDAALQEGEYVSIEYSPAEGGHGFYLENPFIRQEGSKCYVFVAGEGDVLEKREVTVGRALWGSYLEILSGLTMEDRIAFPYGKDVEEGAPIEDRDISDLYTFY